MNRFLAFILMIIVAVAALTPCCVEEERPEKGITAGQHPDAAGDDGCACSPFFACATCPGFVFNARSITIPPPAEYHLLWFEQPSPYFSSAYMSAPWQPPRTAWLC